MTPSIDNNSERNRVERIAQDYRTRGYQVEVQPLPGDLPDFLEGFAPDLILSGKGETVVVEVKTRRELKSPSSFSALEAALQNRPGWRFELIIDGSETEAHQTLTPNQIRTLLQMAMELQSPKFSAAALLVLWSATEGALRLLADQEHVELESLAPEYVVNKLYTLGLLAREQYQTLQRVMRLRNQAAHGFQAAVTSEDLLKISVLSNELLNQVDLKAA